MNQVNHSSSHSRTLHHSAASSGGASVSTLAKIDDGGLYWGGFTSMLCQFYILIYGPQRCNWEGRCHRFEREMKAIPRLIYASFINFYSFFYRSRRACIHCLHRWVQKFIFCMKAKLWVELWCPNKAQPMGRRKRCAGNGSKWLMHLWHGRYIQITWLSISYADTVIFLQLIKIDCWLGTEMFTITVNRLIKTEVKSKMEKSLARVRTHYPAVLSLKRK